MLGLSVPQVAGGALAASTAAAVGSRLGLAGTVGGAAVVSVICAVAGAAYTRGLHHTGSRVSALVRGRAGDRRDEHDPGDAGPRAVPAPRRRLGPWVAAAAVVFVLAGGAVTLVEAVTGHALSGGTGTTISQLSGPGGRAGGSPSTPHPSAEGHRSRSTPGHSTAEPSRRATAAPSPHAGARDGDEPGATARPQPSGGSRPSTGSGSTGSGSHGSDPTDGGGSKGSTGSGSDPGSTGSSGHSDAAGTTAR